MRASSRSAKLVTPETERRRASYSLCRSLPGTRLGPYEVIASLGAGGMGEVHLARDTRLDRKVAIKVLLPGRVGHGASHERFQSEARAVSSLNHPHICTLHDVGEQDGRDYLVMELLEGETVAHRLARGPLPADQILRHAVDIAEALDHAHRHGIVHRDLKPANVMLTKGGAKLLDFGLAKWHATQAPGGAESLATVTREPPLTDHGHVVGTLQYMAPEQLEGQSGRRAHRSVRVRRARARDGHGPEGVRSDQSDGAHRRDPGRGAASDFGAAAALAARVSTASSRSAWPRIPTNGGRPLAIWPTR